MEFCTCYLVQSLPFSGFLLDFRLRKSESTEVGSRDWVKERDIQRELMKCKKGIKC